VPFSLYTIAWLGEHGAFIVQEFIKKWRVAGSNTECISIRFALRRREAVPDKKTIYHSVSNFRQTGKTLEALK